MLLRSPPSGFNVPPIEPACKISRSYLFTNDLDSCLPSAVCMFEVLPYVQSRPAPRERCTSAACFPAHLSAFGQFIIVLHPAHHSGAKQNKTKTRFWIECSLINYFGDSGFLLDLHLILAKFHYCFYEKCYCLVSHRTRYQHTPG